MCCRSSAAFSSGVVVCIVHGEVGNNQERQEVEAARTARASALRLYRPVFTFALWAFALLTGQRTTSKLVRPHDFILHNVL